MFSTSLLKKYYPFVLAVSAGLALTVPVRALAGPSRVLIYDSRKGNLGAQFKAIMSDILPAVGQRTGDKLILDFVTAQDEFVKKLKDPSVQFVHTAEMELTFDFKRLGFVPLVGISLFGGVIDPVCIYVAANGPITSRAGLKGAVARGYPNELTYFMIRQDFGMFADDLFRQYVPGKSGQDAIYALSLGQAEAAISTRSNMSFLKLANPGPLKKIRELNCLKIPNPFPPVYVRSIYPKERQAKIVEIMKGVQKDPAFRRYSSLFKMMNLKFTAPDPGAQKQLQLLMEKGRKSGWNKAYIKWRKVYPRHISG